MLAVDTEGKFYPCIRFLGFCLNNKKELCVGNINDGINEDKLIPFYSLTCESQSTQECLEYDSYQCFRCKSLNKQLTNEINTPYKIQCLISNIERNGSRYIQQLLIKGDIIDDKNYIKKLDELDPLTNLMLKEG